MGSRLIAPPARINQTLPKVFSACGKKRYDCDQVFLQHFSQTGPTLCCLPLQAAACTCSVLCAKQNGVGSVESSGTESVWETTGLVNTHRIFRKIWR